jgi:hypothetical protein
VDLAAAAAEALRRPGQHRVAPVGEDSASELTESFVPPKPCASSTAGNPAIPVARQVERGFQLDRLVTGRAGAHGDLLVDGFPLGGCRAGPPTDQPGHEHEHDRAAMRRRRVTALRRRPDSDMRPKLSGPI